MGGAGWSFGFVFRRNVCMVSRIPFACCMEGREEE